MRAPRAPPGLQPAPAQGRRNLSTRHIPTMRQQGLVDIGINLAHDSYDADRAEVVARAVAAGVTGMVVTGSSIDSTRRAIELCRSWPELLRATAGVHPHHADDFDDAQASALEELLADPQVTAAGECGLDYFRNYSTPAAQRRAFARQLALAANTAKPVFLHQRDAHGDFMAILAEHLPVLPGAVVHCFTGNEAELDEYLAHGLCVGITGWICDERRGLEVRRLAGRIPLERLMLETDGPYLLPRDLLPKPSHRRNESKYLRHIFNVLCTVRSEPPEQVAAVTSATARRFFALPPESAAAAAGQH